MIEIDIGNLMPLGSIPTKTGVNFSLVATNAEYIEILIFENEYSTTPKSIFKLDEKHRTGDYWHAEIKGLTEGAIYAYRVLQKDNGINTDYSKKILIDPCSRGIVGWKNFQRKNATNFEGNVSSSLKSVVCSREKFNFKKFPRPKYSWEDTIIYELHIKGFTNNLNSNEDKQGDLNRILKKLPYLKDLGVTTIELLPIFSFDPSDSPNGLENYWGYSPVNWFTPHYQYFSDYSPQKIRAEFRNFVEQCHKFEIEVILDVVYNHTSEGNDKGPTLSWKGIDENLYYFIDKEKNYRDVSGCGNTIAANRGYVRKLIIESLKCWANEFGVDGFRFDLGIALTRGENLIPLENPPLFQDIESDAELTEIKLISEPWDCAGLYKIKDFPSDSIFTWNGYFRDDVRRFWIGEDNTAWNLSDKIQGSPSIYNENNPHTKSINFITSHDGFTLSDLVSFNSKHNFSNKEHNKDGENNNNSWNHGVEGPTLNPEIIKLRQRQKKNLLLSLFLSKGVPMLLMGDEIGRSQGGNNNTWCQNNSLGWMNWDKNEQDLELFNYVKYLIKIRKKFVNYINPIYEGITSKKDQIEYQWHGTKLDKPDWNSWSHTIAFSIKSRNVPLFWIGLNAYSKNIKFSIPNSKTKWYKIIDTAESENFKPKLLTEGVVNIKTRSSIFIIAGELLESNTKAL